MPVDAISTDGDAYAICRSIAVCKKMLPAFPREVLLIPIVRARGTFLLSISGKRFEVSEVSAKQAKSNTVKETEFKTKSSH